jgi:hypothetical protein
MSQLAKKLPIDPLPSLLSSEDKALTYFVKRDLLEQEVGPLDSLREMPRAQRLMQKQQEDGSWRYPGKNRNVYPETNYDLLETFRSSGQLVAMYGFDRQHPAMASAAEYVFSCQTKEGDIRGVLGTQYMPYYHGLLLELLIRAGYEDDPRVEKGLDWLLTMRQDDGGWLIPLQAVPAKEKTRELWSAPPVPPNRSRPFSHLATGMVLRAFAVHPRYRELEEVRIAGERLRSRFFQSDKYNDRKAPGYWTKFQFPFWWTNILTALDSLALIGFPADDDEIHKGLRWFMSNQEKNGLWRTSYERAKAKELTTKERDAMLWVGLATCRMFKRFYEGK